MYYSYSNTDFVVSDEFEMRRDDHEHDPPTYEQAVKETETAEMTVTKY